MTDEAKPDPGVEELARTLADEHVASTNAHKSGGVSPDLVPPLKPRPVELASPYIDQGELGRGGMGAVRKAIDSDLQRPVAVKVMLPWIASSEPHVMRFVDEARITALLDHPNIAPIHRLAKSPDGSMSLVMKLVEGQTLTSYLRNLPPQPWPPDVLDRVLSIFVKICDGVAFAHSRGIVHLDLKPDNVMVGSFGQVYVMDWGIARYRPKKGEPLLLRIVQRKDAPMGTPVYMSPEQAMRKEQDIDARTDVFLLGAVLYEILTGQRPYEGHSLIAVLSAAIAGHVKPPIERSPERQPAKALSAVAMKALSPRPKDRYQTVLDLQRDVIAFQRGEEFSPQRSYSKGEIVVREGDMGNEAFVVVSGRCAVTTTHDGKPMLLRELGPGDVFGEASVFSHEPRSATVEALEPLVVRVVTGETLSQALGLQSWTGAFVSSLATRFIETSKRLRDIADSKHE